MPPTVTVIAAGMMGSAVGRRLSDNGIRVLTALAGRSAESAARAAAAGMQGADDAEIAGSDLILSIVPPGDALGLAERLSPALTAGNHKPVYVDCNAVNPPSVARIAAAVEATGCPFVDAGIVGGPPRAGYDGPVFYASGAEAPRFAVLNDYGLVVRVIGDGLGEASALKMSYAGITKGLTALASVMMLAATRAGTADALRAELAASQPDLTRWFDRQVPGMFSKAYRWVAEMEEIAGFVGDDPAGRQIFDGASALYRRLAADYAAGGDEIAALRDFTAKKN